MESEEEVLQRIGQRLKELREEAGYQSYENFCLDYELNRKQYWMLEAGRTNPTIRTLLKICNIHGVPLENLLRKGEGNS